MTLDKLKKLAEAATPGHWKFFVLSGKKDPIAVREVANHLNLIAAVAPGHHIRSDNAGGSYPSADGVYIAAACNAVPKLLEMIALKDKALDIFRRALDESAPESMLEPAFDASRRADEIERSLGE